MRSKICSKCKSNKKFNQFNRGNDKFGLHYWCNSCCRKNWQHPKQKLSAKKYWYSSAGIYKALKAHAKQRAVEFNLNKEDFIMWYEKQEKLCVYCGKSEAEAIKDIKGVFHRLTIDRKDSLRGYCIDNIALCCSICNSIKSKYLTYSEMIKVGQIIKRRKR